MSAYPKTSSAIIDYHDISLYPSQMDIAITEKCNQNCDYCFVNKSNPKILNLTSIKKAIDIFYSFPVEERTITFVTAEPLIYPNLYKKTINYILSKADQKNINLHLVTTTNGILLDKEIRDFVDKLDERFRLNISLDGKKNSHDAHRRLRNNPNKSAFDLSWKNFKAIGSKDKVRILVTVAPSEAPLLRENVEFILKNGFKNIGIFPQMLTFWKDSELAELREKLSSSIKYLNNQQGNNSDLRILNRLWGSSHYAKILLGSDAKFYLFEWVLTLPYLKRKRYVIGDVEKGIDFKKRLMLFREFFNKTLKESNGRCIKCGYREFCYCPLPLFIWCHHHKKNFNKYLKNFCKISKIFIDLAAEIKYEIKNELDREKLTRCKKRT